LSFPFRVKSENISSPGQYVVRYYDGGKRADGQSGWTAFEGEALLPGQGYIFQTNQTGTLSLGVEQADMNWQADDREQSMEAHTATNASDASWNFVGNPHTSYFDVDATGYEQPITVWNGSSYEAVRPGDDDYALRPFEAFFVQKPDGEASIGFPAEGRATYLQTQSAAHAKAARRRSAGGDSKRQIVNLTLDDGQTQDKTRVVFNEHKSSSYELDCDAAKFMSSEQVPQLYSLDQQLTRYAINERPVGQVPLGYVAVESGELTIATTRMDRALLLRDNATGTVHDLSLGNYTFTTESGTFDNRFTLEVDQTTTGVGDLAALTGVSLNSQQGGIAIDGSDGHAVSVYSADGVLIATKAQDGFLALPCGTYIIKVDQCTATKVMVR